MKKVKLVIGNALAVAAPWVFSAQKALAQNTKPNGAAGNAQQDLPFFITKVSGIALSIIALIAILFLIIGGFQYVTSQGNPDQIDKAKRTVLYAVIGLIIAIISWVVINFVKKSLTGTDLT